ncbi:uncharacterized protein BP5553_04397 [Venustampulla echinocandica]|uniref:Uncharacterized protein n=1 Tax=Venustampulla echinocandica TaxID=2656787 RepID=A0A370TN69_9HELO|nr:uncharacterized protein BP5553_04397 [Venustampulla echinocandica]RDL36964.1 hypothetical protein BP5553_04397 [Venustampulla echinocandica]
MAALHLVSLETTYMQQCETSRENSQERGIGLWWTLRKTAAAENWDNCIMVRQPFGSSGYVNIMVGVKVGIITGVKDPISRGSRMNWRRQLSGWQPSAEAVLADKAGEITALLVELMGQIGSVAIEVVMAEMLLVAVIVKACEQLAISVICVHGDEVYKEVLPDAGAYKAAIATAMGRILCSKTYVGLKERM